MITTGATFWYRSWRITFLGIIRLEGFSNW